jgi:hypothetical protein
MVALRKAERRAHKSIGRIAHVLRKAKKHHHQAKKSVAAIKKIHAQAKTDLKRTRKK